MLLEQHRGEVRQRDYRYLVPLDLANEEPLVSFAVRSRQFIRASAHKHLLHARFRHFVPLADGSKPRPSC